MLKLSELTGNFVVLQNRCLLFANEAYYESGSMKDILNKQANRGIKTSRLDLLTAGLMNMGYAIQHPSRPKYSSRLSEKKIPRESIMLSRKAYLNMKKHGNSPQDRKEIYEKYNINKGVLKNDIKERMIDDMVGFFLKEICNNVHGYAFNQAPFKAIV